MIPLWWAAGALFTLTICIFFIRYWADETWDVTELLLLTAGTIVVTVLWPISLPILGLYSLLWLLVRDKVWPYRKR